MVRRKRKNPVGRLGARYGKRVRERVADIEIGLRRNHPCQNCGFRAVSRVSVGVWKCRKCGRTFSGAAYTPTSDLGVTAERSIPSSS